MWLKIKKLLLISVSLISPPISAEVLQTLFACHAWTECRDKSYTHCKVEQPCKLFVVRHKSVECHGFNDENEFVVIKETCEDYQGSGGP